MHRFGRPGASLGRQRRLFFVGARLRTGPAFSPREARPMRCNRRLPCLCRASDVQARLMRSRSETWREVAGAVSPSLRLGLCPFAWMAGQPSGLIAFATLWVALFLPPQRSARAAHAVQVGDLAGGCRYGLAILALGPVSLRLDGRATLRVDRFRDPLGRLVFAAPAKRKGGPCGAGRRPGGRLPVRSRHSCAWACVPSLGWPGNPPG